MFRSRRDADLTTAIYRRMPVLVDRSDLHHGVVAGTSPSGAEIRFAAAAISSPPPGGLIYAHFFPRV